MAKAHIGRDVGDKLRQVAYARGLSQGQVAANAHVSQPTISALFNGQTLDPPLGTVVKVAKVLGVSIDELVGFKPLQIPVPAIPSDDRLAALEEKFERLVSALGPALQGTADLLSHDEAHLQGADTQQRPRKAPKRTA